MNKSKASDPSIEVLKEDIAEFVRETHPEDEAAARQELEQWDESLVEAPEETLASKEEAEPVPVYNALDEISARLVAALLESEGIEVMITQHATPMLNTEQQMIEGIWGQVFVHHKDAAVAATIIATTPANDEESISDATESGG